MKMGRKKKTVTFLTANEDKASNTSSETKTGVEKLHSHPMEATNVENSGHQISNGAKREKNSRVGSVVVRRSSRINSLASPTNSLEVEPVVEHIDLVEDEKEQELEVQQGSDSPQANEGSLEEKVSEQEDAPDISYKSLYIDSQKKIELLIEENYELVRKLEFARGKIAAYEAMKDAVKDAVGAQKEFVLVSQLGKVAGLSPKAVEKCFPTPPADSPIVPKPKKTYQKRARH
ncbi:uncharacterized protein LOC130999177 [Salvia miltiorrhiza]|uniref:uncharacterized protein LOC130999177 n=1 Tax=Salvia miltiorrhiza TaxID=226208 RepID=UPI0025ABD8A1|nr:uncharacterized protein LOC130999177 [Salvia miltiorrhiza]